MPPIRGDKRRRAAGRAGAAAPADRRLSRRDRSGVAGGGGAGAATPMSCSMSVAASARRACASLRGSTGCRIVGLERDAALARLAAENATQNGFSERLSIVEGDLLRPPAALRAGRFQPGDDEPAVPRGGESVAVAAGAQGRGRGRGRGKLAAIGSSFALGMLRDKGVLTLIHRADRLGDIFAALGRPRRRHHRVSAVAGRGQAGEARFGAS